MKRSFRTRAARLALALAAALASTAGGAAAQATPAARRPNILFAISDDQSYPYASAYGSRTVQTPNFDRVAREGVLFTNAFVASPGCSPSRAAFLTGRQIWQIENAGTHASSFPKKFVVFPDLLEKAGYAVGYTGKGWGPGDWKASGRTRNPAGPAFNARTLTPPHRGISTIDYAANFADFLKTRSKNQPFYFWYGAHEPHRAFEEGAGLRAGRKLSDAEVPPFLPDAPEIRSDILDYGVEIAWFDQQLGRMLKMLDEAGELDNTIVIVTSDNGMSFPRAKANSYEPGIHVPLAIRWGAKVPGGRTVADLVSLVDLTPTILQAAGVAPTAMLPLSGRSILEVLTSRSQGLVDPSRVAIYSGRERHSSARYNSLGYPQRAIRTQRYLYVRNFTPERWPSGAPRILKKDGTPGPYGAFPDIDAAPSLTYMTEHRDDASVSRLFHLTVDHRPAEELYDIVADPACLHNLIDAPAQARVALELRTRLNSYLRQTHDPRVMGNGDVFESYPRLVGAIREFPEPEWAKRADKVVRPAWLDPASKPNIVFILADDLGYGDLGSYGQTRIRTPNLDRMAREGMRFTQHYAGALVCAPSRSVLMTGMHMGHTTVRGNFGSSAGGEKARIPLRAEDFTVAELLERAGYTTAMIGKWGLGEPGTVGLPRLQGFDYFLGYLNQARAHEYYPDYVWRNGRKMPLPGNLNGKKTQYSHDLFADSTLAFLERNRDHPFFLYLPYTLPHALMEVPRDSILASYSGLYPEKEATFAAMVTRLDRDVGRILAKLRELGLDRNTIVIFAGDNGPHREDGHDPDFFDSNGPLRGIKRDMYEGGIRIPMLAFWPGHVQPGSVSDHVSGFQDFLATAADLAGVPAPATDGISYLPALLGKPQPTHPYLYWEFYEGGAVQAVRLGDWKAIRRPGFTGKFELYDLASDLGEQRDVAAAHPDVIRRVTAIMEHEHVASPYWGP